MSEIAHITYANNGSSVKEDKMGMRVMQRKIYDRRNEQYLLLKSPPASGKSRACMYIALDKLVNQGIKKVIIAVPERTIASSFAATDLVTGGFFCNWNPSEQYDLCSMRGGDESIGKVAKFKSFMDDPAANILLCTHATLRYAFREINDATKFNDCFVAIDEIHHSSSTIEESNRLGEVIENLCEHSTAHLLTMTGSYFRGDGVSVLSPSVEEKFTSVTYTYYEQLSGYKYLNTINLSYDFYSGTYYEALERDLDLSKKTIIHIPNVNSRESTGQKYVEVDKILDIIGTFDYEDKETGVYYINTEDGKTLKVIDWVDDNPETRMKRGAYIRENASNKDAIDIIIALNLAKEGFDWPACERMITVGYRGSLTEIVQIIGRCTRDFPGKSEAEFINIIAEPDATTSVVAETVNDLLKAVTASLLMEQVLLPKWNLKAKMPKLKLKEPQTERAKKIIENDMADLIAAIMMDPETQKVIMKPNSGRLINKGIAPKIILEKYPDLSEDDREAIRQRAVAQIVIDGGTETDKSGKPKPGGGFLKFSDKVVIDIRDLDINMIDSIKPFDKAYQIISKDIDKKTLMTIQDAIDTKMNRNQQITDIDVAIYGKAAREYFYSHGKRFPNPRSEDPYEAKLGQVVIYMKKKRLANGK